MSETTARLGLPLLAAGQAEKEVLHNEAVSALEAVAIGLVEAGPGNIPPGAPSPGQFWPVGIAPTGAWVGHAGTMALWTEGGWRFLPTVEGLSVRVKGSGLTLERRAAGWTSGEIAATALMIGGTQVVGARVAAIANPTAGAVVDSEARTTLAAILVALRTHGLVEV